MSCVSIKISADKLPKPRLEPTRPVWSKPTIEYPEDAEIIEIIYEQAPERKPVTKPKEKPVQKPKTAEPPKVKAFRRVQDHNRKEWTEEETQILITMFNAGKKYREIADEVDHEQNAIASKLRELRKKGLVGTKSKPKWTAEQDAILLAKTDQISYAMIAEQVGKSASACYSRHLRLEAKRWKEQQE